MTNPGLPLGSQQPRRILGSASALHRRPRTREEPSGARCWFLRIEAEGNRGPQKRA
jgi:hypothetical protein